MPSHSPTGRQQRTGVGVRHPRSLPPALGVSSGSTTRSCSCSRDCGGDCAGARRGWARRTLGRGRRGRRAPHKTPFLSPRPRPALPRGRPCPQAGNAGGSERSRDPLPSLQRFPAAAAARARTSEVGHRPGDENPKTWSREGGREGRRGGQGALAIYRMMLQLEGWKLDCRRDFPFFRGRGGGIQPVEKRMKGEWEGGFAPGETSHV